MDEVIECKMNYSEYKMALDTELQKTADSFVKIGYLLKLARDTNVLAESGYKTVAEFAAAEYNLDKTQVSRFIPINDKFSEGGYSDHLMQAYCGYGYAKLTIMLQLPAEINEELTPRYSKAEIQSIKDEVDEEKKVTDIERMLEGESDKPLIAQVILAIGKDHPQLYLKISDRFMMDECVEENIQDLMAPQGEATYSVRVQGRGRVMLMISEESVKMVNTRTGEKEETDWHEIWHWWSEIAGSEKAWESLYGEPFPQKAAVAPVQQKKAEKPSKVVKAKPEANKEPKQKPPTEPETLKKEPQEEPEQRTLHEPEPSIPIPEPVEPETAPEEPREETQEENLPGQQDMENDYLETVPDVGNTECEGDPEEVGQAAEMTPIQEILLKRADSMIGHIRVSEWEDALKDISQLEECIKNIMGGHE